MKKVNFNKQMQSIYNQYKNSRYSDNLYDCYNQPSWNKVNAMVYCRKLCDQYNGYNLKIIGFNNMQFSVGFECMQDNELCFVYITKSYDRIATVK